MSASMSTSASLPNNTAKTHRSTLSEHSAPLPFFPKPMTTSTTPSSPVNSPMDRPHSATHSRSQSYYNDMIDVPARSTSLRRKPVPQLESLPNNSIPPSHPFAASIPSPNSQLSPGYRADEDLFFTSPRRNGPVPPRRSRPASPASTSTYNPDQQEEAFRQREEALRAREEELRRREEFFKREEALRQREEELRAREEAFYARETASPRPESHSISQGTRRQWLDTNASVLQRPLPPVPDPSQPNLVGSTDSVPALVTRSSTPAGSSRPKARQTLAQKLHLARATSPRIAITHPNGSTSSIPLSATPPEQFSVEGLPTQKSILEAGTLFIRDENGDLVCFGDLFPHPHSPAQTIPGDIPAGLEGEDLPPITKTVVFFIRHFWCGQCQDYTFASLALLDPVAIRKAGVRVVVISNGSWKIIKAYKRVLKCPFPIYVDGPRKLYHVLGMTKMTNDFGPMFKGRAAYHQRPVPTQLLHALGTSLMNFPLADPGKLTQLGGEFIFSSGYTCDFAHRMTNTSNHMEAPEVMQMAGVANATLSENQTLAIEAVQEEELARMKVEMDNWQKQREAELERIRRRKAERRGLTYDPLANGSRLGFPDFDAEEEDLADEHQTPPTQDHHTEETAETSETAVPAPLELDPEIQEKFVHMVNLNDSIDGGLGEKTKMVSPNGRGDLEVQVEKD